MTGDRSRRGRPLHPDEGELFRRAMGDVRPLRGAVKGAEAKKAERPPKAKDRTVGQARGTPQSPAAAGRKDAPPLEHGRAPGLDKRTALRMKRGKVVIDARIDLHGMTQEAAHRALNAFLAAAQDADRRCVLVITGKGSVRDGGGVLRTNVPRWLNEPVNRARVHAFSHAAPRDGGEGALYVLVKRRK